MGGRCMQPMDQLGLQQGKPAAGHELFARGAGRPRYRSARLAGVPPGLTLSPSGAEMAQCSLLYVAQPDVKEMRKALERVEGTSVLTVGETDAFARAGGMVALVNSGDRIQIEVNLEAAQSAGIKISSRVLNLAVIVRPDPKGGN